MSALKIGGLALIVRSEMEKNLGRTVETVAYLGNSDPMEVGGTFYANPLRADAWHIVSVNTDPLYDGDGDECSELPFASAGLMPINGDDDVNATDEKEKSNAGESNADTNSRAGKQQHHVRA